MAGQQQTILQEARFCLTKTSVKGFAGHDQARRTWNRSPEGRTEAPWAGSTPALVPACRCPPDPELPRGPSRPTLNEDPLCLPAKLQAAILILNKLFFT